MPELCGIGESWHAIAYKLKNKKLSFELFGACKMHCCRILKIEIVQQVW
jgi:hypothetical protein